jgi:hypothetical protein
MYESDLSTALFPRLTCAPRASFRPVDPCFALSAALLLICWGSAASATVMISELFYDSTGSDDGKVFVELSGPPGTSLEGFSLEGVNGSNGAIGPVVTLSGEISESGLFVLADRSGSGTVFVPNPDLVANFDFQNGPDSVVLRLGETVVDALGYGVFGGADVFAGEGEAAPDAPAGSSLARLLADVDSDNNRVDFEVLLEPTPGAAEFLLLPEPATGLLMGTGLGVMALLRRRSPERARCRPPHSRLRLVGDRFPRQIL